MVLRFLVAFGMCAICSVKSCTTLVMPPHHPFFLRTALLAVLQGRPGQLAVVLAIVCASFVSICRATTQRSYLNPMGCAAVLGVQCGNLLASRPGHPFKQACNLISKQWYTVFLSSPFFDVLVQDGHHHLFDRSDGGEST